MKNKQKKSPKLARSTDDQKSIKKRSIIKDWVGITQSVLTSIAIVSAGIWFFVRGEGTKKLGVTHYIESVEVSRLVNFVDISLSLENLGTTPINIEKVKLVIQKVKPLDKHLQYRVEDGFDLLLEGEQRIDFTVIFENVYKNRVSLRPGEEEAINLHAAFDSEIEVIRVYTFIPSSDGEIGWKQASIHRMKVPAVKNTNN